MFCSVQNQWGDSGQAFSWLLYNVFYKGRGLDATGMGAPGAISGVRCKGIPPLLDWDTEWSKGPGPHLILSLVCDI